MTFVACGLNHKTAPLSVRERVALVPGQHAVLLERLMQEPHIHEASLLSTCNRTEIYCETDAPDALGRWLSYQHDISESDVRNYLYQHTEQDGIRHTLRVASGLDSMMLGEPQILGQMKQSYQQALQAGTVKSTLRGIFEHVFSASKRIRNLSGIGKNPVSIAYAGVQLIRQNIRELQHARVFIIGAGETSSLVCKYLHQAGVHDFTIASRTHSNAQKLAATVCGATANIGDIPHLLHSADIVITATACPLPFINRSLVQHAMAQRENRHMFLLDLAVPRDIEACVAQLDNVHLFNIDDLQQRISEGMDDRRNRAREAEALIETEIHNYVRWHRSLRADALISEYRNQMQRFAADETQRALRKINNGTSTEAVLKEMSHRLLNKLTHHTSTGFKSIASEDSHDIYALAQHFFDYSESQSLYEEIS